MTLLTSFIVSVVYYNFSKTTLYKLFLDDLSLSINLHKEVTITLY
jgi:hypothetical protein